MWDFGKIGEALKTALSAAAIYKLALAFAFGLFWLLATRGFVPSPENWQIQLAIAGAIFFSFLWFASAVASFLDFLSPRQHILYWLNNHKEASHICSYIPSMTPKERQIIAYLLAKNQKLFITSIDGGYAMPLISQRIVVRALQSNQVFNESRTPFVVPDHVWNVLQKHKDQFPYTAPEDSREPVPWVIPWQLR